MAEKRRFGRIALSAITTAAACALLASPASAASFSNNTPFNINDGFCPGTQAPASLYPSSILVAGQTGIVTDVNVTLTGFSHTFPSDVRALLVSPSGQTTLLMHGAGGNTAASNVTFTLDDAGATPIPTPIVAGFFQPTQTASACVTPATSLPAPAPAGPYGLTLADVNGGAPNGTWSLYVVDAAGFDTGSIQGWTLDLATAAAPPYATAVLNDYPSGYWRMGEPSGTTMFDSSILANHGTYLGGVALGAPGAIVSDPNTAATFDGINDTARVPHTASINVGDLFSAEAWIKRSTATKSYELFNKGANGLQLVAMSAGSGNQVWLRKAGVTTLARSATGLPVDGAYHHIVATMSGPGTEKIYIDGLLNTAPVTAPQTLATTTFPLTFGGAAGAPANYDEFALYDHVLGAGEVAEHHSAGIAP